MPLADTSEVTNKYVKFVVIFAPVAVNVYSYFCQPLPSGFFVSLAVVEPEPIHAGLVLFPYT